jgi:hypothetical protein
MFFHGFDILMTKIKKIKKYFDKFLIKNILKKYLVL